MLTDSWKTGVVTMLSLALASVSANADYELTFKGGKFPAGVEATSLSSFVPDASGYQRGWTRDGWTVDRYGSIGYVALAPTFNLSELKVESLLALPQIEIGENDVLSWNAISFMAERPESYSVVAIDVDTQNITSLIEIERESSSWHPRALALGGLAGKNVRIGFLATSSDGYMLALSGVKISAPESGNIQFCGQMPRHFFGTEDLRDESSALNAVAISMTLTNTGAILSSGRLSAISDGKEQYHIDIDNNWMPGEEREVSFLIPASMDASTPYSIEFAPLSDSEQKINLFESSFYTSDFRRNLVVDEGTGMWCVNCPNGIMALDDLERTYPGSVIELTTHYNDYLQNISYFNALGYRQLPYMTLNRIASSSGENTKNFGDYIDMPCRFGIDLAANIAEDGSIIAKANITSAESVDNAAGNLRIGYVLIQDFHKPGFEAFYQRNNISITSGLQYYYLPSTIPSDLAYFHNVTLSEASEAFDGIEGSLPAELKSGESYEHTWRIVLPDWSERTGLEIDARNCKVVAFLLDSTDSHILNAAVTAVGNDATGAINYIPGEAEAIDAGMIYNLHGIPMGRNAGILPPGIYIRNGKKIAKPY